MTRPVIRLGDRTSHDGAVIAVDATHFQIDGRPVARIGDRCSCPRRGHVDCVIATGNGQFVVDGRAVAFEGDLTSCGAELIASASGFDA